MKKSQRPCRLVQEDIACNRGLSQEDNQHILSCRSCAEVAAKIAELDSLICNVTEHEISPDFADRVVAKISEEECQSGNLYSQWLPLLERIFYSRGIQWLLVGIGSAFGLVKIFRFFSAVLVRGFI